MKVLRKIEKCFKGVIRVFQESFKGLKRSLKVVSRKFQGCFMIFKGVPRVFQRCFKEASIKLSGCFKKVSGCLALIAASRAEGGLVYF